MFSISSAVVPPVAPGENARSRPRYVVRSGSATRGSYAARSLARRKPPVRVISASMACAIAPR